MQGRKHDLSDIFSDNIDEAMKVTKDMIDNLKKIEDIQEKPSKKDD
jgi:hypothetical protein